MLTIHGAICEVKNQLQNGKGVLQFEVKKPDKKKTATTPPGPTGEAASVVIAIQFEDSAMVEGLKHKGKYVIEIKPEK